jgi:hypothetical protein
MVGGLGLPFEVCGPSSGSVTNLGSRLPRLQRGSHEDKVAFRDYREDPAILGPAGGAATVI